MRYSSIVQNCLIQFNGLTAVAGEKGMYDRHLNMGSRYGAVPNAFNFSQIFRRPVFLNISVST